MDKKLITSSTIIGGLIIILSGVLTGLHDLSVGGINALLADLNTVALTIGSGVAVIGGRKALGNLIVKQEETITAVQKNTDAVVTNTDAVKTTTDAVKTTTAAVKAS